MASYPSTLTGQQMEAAMLAMPDSEAYAKGTRNGVPVENGDPAYHNNSKYYAEEAARVVPAGGVGAVRYDVSQPLTETEKAQARENIGAGGGDMNKSVYDTDNDGKVDEAEIADNAIAVTIQTTAPTADWTGGGYKFCKLASEPATRYNGWIYLITTS